jgi:hypothetical protein
MERVDGWAAKLENYLLERHDKAFEWGTTDCCMFVGDSIRIITGVDVVEYFRGKYNKILPAFALMKDYSNGGSVQETWERIAGCYEMKQIRTKALLPGDLVTMKAEACNPVAGRLSNGITVGIQSFTTGILSQGADSLMLSTKPNIMSAWKI